MTREEISLEISKIDNPYLLLELATSVGKSKLAIERVSQIVNKSKKVEKILIVVPKLVLFRTWTDEFIKWGYKHLLSKVSIITYASFHKYTGSWDIVIFDEAHHLSDRCFELLQYYKIKNVIGLSATINDNIKMKLNSAFKGIYCYKISARDAIDNEILPDPKVILIPLTLDNKLVKYTIIKNQDAGGLITIPYKKRWEYAKVKNHTIHIQCTQQEYYNDMSNMIEWYKSKFMRSRNEFMRNRWLHKSKERLDWLSSLKNEVILDLLKTLKDKRTLVFCSNIEQTESLGKYCINSKNEDSDDNLNKFNSGVINHITACNMLNEGVNLINCQYGIYANCSSSETIIAQRLGRILRHESPIIIIPYFKNTREEEIVGKMLESYNSDLITVLNKFQ